MKKIFFALVIVLFISSCSQNKDLNLNGQVRTFEPYGWANSSSVSNDSIIYTPVVGNIIWSVILSETVIAPIYLTGWSLFEPSEVKTQYKIK